MAHTTDPASSKATLVRQLGLWSSVAVVVGSTIGSGIFKSPAAVAEKLPGPIPMLAVWVLGGLFILCGALTLAEVGGAFPYSGGLYVFIREAFGRLPAFLFGWAQLILIRPSGVGAVAVVFGQYALQLAGLDPEKAGFDNYAAILAIGAIVVVTVANVLGVKFGAGIQNLTTIAKTAGLVVLIVFALALGLPASHGANFTTSAPPGAITFAPFGLALVSALWAYDGWADCSFVGGEMLDPRKNLPRAIMIGTGIIITVYLLANVAYLSVFSVAEIAKSKIIAADTMSKLVGGTGLTFIVATVMLSTFGTLNGTMLTAPRIFFAMSEDRLIFKPLSAVHPKFNTPHVSVILSGALGIFFVILATAFSGSKAFGALTDAFVIGIVPFYALAVGSVFVFRGRERKRRATDGDKPLADSLIDPISPGHLDTHPHVYSPPVHTPLYPITPALFILSTFFLLLNSLLDESSRVPTVISLGVVLAGAPIYYAAFGKKVKS